MQQKRLINNSSQLNMFRAIILPIFRNTRLCVTACGITHPRCCWPPAFGELASIVNNQISDVVVVWQASLPVATNCTSPYNVSTTYIYCTTS